MSSTKYQIPKTINGKSLPHTYRVYKLLRIVTTIFITVVLFGVTYLQIYAINNIKNTPSFAIAILFCIAGFQILLMYGLIVAFRSKLTIYPDKVVCNNFLFERELLFSEIEGYTYPNEGGAIYLIPNDKTRKILGIPFHFEDSEAIDEFLTSFLQDLDAIKLEAESNSIITDKRYGSSDFERSQILDKARQYTRIFSLITLLVSFWMLISHPPKLVFPLAIAIPVLALILVKKSKGMISLIPNLKAYSVRPNIWFITIMMTIFGARAFLSFLIIDYQIMLIFSGILAILISGIFFLIAKEEFSEHKFAFLTYFIIIIIYAYGLTTTINCIYDTSPHLGEQLTVLEKNVTRDENNTYYYILTESSKDEAKTFSISSKSIYDSVQINDVITSGIKQGLLGARWLNRFSNAGYT